VARPARPAVTAPALLTPTIAACLAISGGVHVVIYLLNATLPLHVVHLGGSKTQVGLLFATATTVSMVLRPLVGGWVDRFGARRVMLPGTAVLIGTLLVLPLAASPGHYVALMAGLGCGNGVLATAAGVLVAQASPPARRGEALSVYFLATALSFAAGPPLGLALYGRGGIRSCFVAALILGGLITPLILFLRAPGLEALPGKGFRLFSRRALPAAATVVCVNLGYSSIYAFLPLYALASGLEGSLGWFYVLFAVCIISGRLILRGLSDRIGRAPVIVPAVALTTLSYLILAQPPRVPTLAAAAVMLGAGVAMFYPTLLALLVDRTPEAERGSAMGTLSGSFDLGSVLGSLLVGFTVERVSFAAGFHTAAAGALAGLTLFVVAERRRAGRGLSPGSTAGV
jgi:MFS family permease